MHPTGSWREPVTRDWLGVADGLQDEKTIDAWKRAHFGNCRALQARHNCSFARQVVFIPRRSFLLASMQVPNHIEIREVDLVGAVPEPASLALVSTGIAGVAGLSRGRRRKQG